MICQERFVMDKFPWAQNHKKEPRNSSYDRIILLMKEKTIHIEEEKKLKYQFLNKVM